MEIKKKNVENKQKVRIKYLGTKSSTHPHCCGPYFYSLTAEQGNLQRYLPQVCRKRQKKKNLDRPRVTEDWSQWCSVQLKQVRALSVTDKHKNETKKHYCRRKQVKIQVKQDLLG